MRAADPSTPPPSRTAVQCGTGLSGGADVLFNGLQLMAELHPDGATCDHRSGPRQGGGPGGGAPWLETGRNNKAQSTRFLICIALIFFRMD